MGQPRLQDVLGISVNQYIYFVTPVRETFLADATPDELEIIERHFEYLKDLLAEDRLILAGRCQDGPPGIIVFEAKETDAARELMQNDPAVKAGIFTAELRPYRVSLLRGH